MRLKAGDKSNQWPSTNYNMVSIFSPKQRAYFIFGGGQAHKVDVSSGGFSPVSYSTSGCTFVSASWPGITYDPLNDRIVAWSGGNTIDILNPYTGTCTTQTFTGGPIANSNGTYKRWFYSQKEQVFGVINRMNDNMFTLRTQAKQTAFAMRCAQPGVILCEGFDDVGAFQQSVPTSHEGASSLTYLRPASDNVYRGVRDISVIAEGASSLRFDQSTAYTDANLSGSYVRLLGATFSQNSQFYVQYRQRYSSSFLTNTIQWDSSPKQMILHKFDSSCASIEITQNFYQFENWPSVFPQLYGGCGAFGFYTNLARTTMQQGTPLLIQQSTNGTSGYDCQYSVWTIGSGNGNGCWRPNSDTWYTQSYFIKLGAWNTASSVVKAWVSEGSGGVSYQWINVPNANLSFNTVAADGYNTITLTPYMTGLSVPGAGNSSLWYDSMIVSRLPIEMEPVLAATSTGTRRTGGGITLRGGVTVP
jgi:hypothetical protein